MNGNDSVSIDRRDVLRATAGTGFLSVFGQQAAAAEGSEDADDTDDAGDVPDVLITNLADRPRSVTLALGFDGDAAAAPAQTAVEVGPGSSERVRDLGGDLATDDDARTAPDLSSDGGRTLRVSDDRSASDTVPIPGNFSRSNRIADVSLTPQSTTVDVLHFDREPPTAGGD